MIKVTKIEMNSWDEIRCLDAIFIVFLACWRDIWNCLAHRDFQDKINQRQKVLIITLGSLIWSRDIICLHILLRRKNFLWSKICKQIMSLDQMRGPFISRFQVLFFVSLISADLGENWSDFNTVWSFCQLLLCFIIDFEKSIF